MSEVTIENEKQLDQEEVEANAAMNESGVDEGKTSPKTSKKKTLTIICIIAAVVIVAIVLLIVLIPSEFERVQNDCFHIAGRIGTGKNYFTLDTDPLEDLDDYMRAVLLPETQRDALEAIKYANEKLGFPGSVYSDMLKTSAMMGRQSEENNKYKVSWTYHPDHGLEVTYTKK